MSSTMKVRGLYGRPLLEMRLLATVSAAVAAAPTVVAAPAKARYNVLFFAVDDLRYQL